MEESGTERTEKEVERKAKEKNERVQGTRRKGWKKFASPRRGRAVDRDRGGPRWGEGDLSPRLWSVPFFILRAQASAVFMAVI